MSRHNNYKVKNTDFRMDLRGKRGNKRGQVAIFVIIAIVIVIVVLVIFLVPQIRTSILPGELSPRSYLEKCIEPTLDPSIELLAKQGGFENPEGFILYQDTKVKYLCYTSEFYQTCTVQEPMITTRFKQELTRMISPQVKQCFTNLKEEYEKRGYSVFNTRTDFVIDMDPENIKIIYTSPLTVNKGESSQTFRDFTVEKNSRMYNLLSIAGSIVEYENTYGDSETSLYLQYYPNLKIEKIKLSDGSKIYILTDVTTDETFTFASRSLSWPPGYTTQ